eukprot:TRINITY_DN49855_c0_g1_i1.p1 TRINITY_DN49855_c0_g1~~TRINITY_DN49855_c0_g1_i1.p1  ORF type:complete len:143 (-),score=0.38 TRINITY_DN49855_c0_g1_i1:36-464(-)
MCTTPPLTTTPPVLSANHKMEPHHQMENFRSSRTIQSNPINKDHRQCRACHEVVQPTSQTQHAQALPSKLHQATFQLPQKMPENNEMFLERTVQEGNHTHRQSKMGASLLLPNNFLLLVPHCTLQGKIRKAFTPLRERKGAL